MAIKSGKILTVAGRSDGFLLDRLQSVGPDNINIPSEKVYETGNEESVEEIFDTPTVGWSMESWDVTCEAEAVICGIDPTTIEKGQVFTFAGARPLDVVAPFKNESTSKTAITGQVIPFLILQSAAYRFGVGQTATQTFSFQGDVVYVSDACPYKESFSGAGSPAGTYTFGQTAKKTVEQGNDLYALSAMIRKADGTTTRLFFGEDYTNTSTTITLVGHTLSGGDTLEITYASDTPSDFAQSIHPTPSVKPGGLRGKDIEVWVATAPGPNQPLDRWRGLQSVDATWSVQLEVDDELGNARHVDQSWDIQETTGSIVMRPATVADLMEKIRRITGTAAGDVANVLTTEPLELQFRLKHPKSGAILKTIRVKDAQIQVPAIQARVQQRVDPTFAFTGASGIIEVINGAPITSLTITPDPVSVAAAGTEQLAVTATYADGTNAVVTSSCTFTSDTPAVATVSASGLVTGVAGGTADVTVALHGVEETVTVNVT